MRFYINLLQSLIIIQPFRKRSSHSCT